jgi:sugar O-acyltransferase (sialic acid O-acetyltransferase NeuD family)
MIYIIGSGGHAKVVYDTLLVSGQDASEIAIHDGNPSVAGSKFFRNEVVWPEIIDTMAGGTAHIAIGSNLARAILSEKLAVIQAKNQTIVHPRASVSCYSDVGDGCFIAACSVIGPDSAIGRSVIVNHGSVVDHDCTIGDFSHIAPNATLGGSVKIGRHCLIGAGATILPGLSLADHVTVGAGAVVTADIASGDSAKGFWVGSPARQQGD